MGLVVKLEPLLVLTVVTLFLESTLRLPEVKAGLLFLAETVELVEAVELVVMVWGLKAETVILVEEEEQAKPETLLSLPKVVMVVPMGVEVEQL